MTIFRYQFNLHAQLQYCCVMIFYTSLVCKITPNLNRSFLFQQTDTCWTKLYTYWKSNSNKWSHLACIWLVMIIITRCTHLICKHSLFNTTHSSFFLQLLLLRLIFFIFFNIISLLSGMHAHTWSYLFDVITRRTLWRDNFIFSTSQMKIEIGIWNWIASLFENFIRFL